MNLLSETIEILHEHGKTLGDVIWFGFWNEKFPLDKLTDILDVDYNNDYGCQYIHPCLLVCGKNWWLERGEYDGAEWWEYKEKPKEPKSQAKHFDIICN